MNKDTIRRLVSESHLDVYGLGTNREKWEATVQRFVALVLLHERDRCAMIADAFAQGSRSARMIAEEIRKGTE